MQHTGIKSNTLNLIEDSVTRCGSVRHTIIILSVHLVYTVLYSIFPLLIITPPYLSASNDIINKDRQTVMQRSRRQIHKWQCAMCDSVFCVYCLYYNRQINPPILWFIIMTNDHTECVEVERYNPVKVNLHIRCRLHTQSILLVGLLDFISR